MYPIFPALTLTIPTWTDSELLENSGKKFVTHCTDVLYLPQLLGLPYWNANDHFRTLLFVSWMIRMLLSEVPLLFKDFFAIQWSSSTYMIQNMSVDLQHSSNMFTRYWVGGYRKCCAECLLEVVPVDELFEELRAVVFPLGCLGIYHRYTIGIP